jgi:hypothetical protein
VQPERLDEYGGWVFWRFELLLAMGAAERRVQYAFHADGVDPERRCAPGPAPLARPRLPPARDAPDRPRRWAFVVPGREQRWRWAYYSCNGMDQDADVKKFGKPHLWADLLRRHDAAPLHALVGGGDQLYNDGLWRSPSLGPWLGGDGLHPGTVYNSEVRGWLPAGPEGVGLCPYAARAPSPMLRPIPDAARAGARLIGHARPAGALETADDGGAAPRGVRLLLQPLPHALPGLAAARGRAREHPAGAPPGPAGRLVPSEARTDGLPASSAAARLVGYEGDMLPISPVSAGRCQVGAC